MIAREPFTPALLAELRPLILANHEATGNPDQLDPSWHVFEQLDCGGALCLLVVRLDGVAVGYAAHLAQVNQNTGKMQATCLAIYLRPEHRRLARRLVAHAEELARNAGAHLISYSVPHMSRAGSFFEALGYECGELVMGKRLA